MVTRSDRDNAFSAGIACCDVLSDDLPHNEFTDSVNTATTSLFPDDPPGFLARIPYGYHDIALMATDLSNAGFMNPPEFNTLPMRSRAKDARLPAIAFCAGTPLRGEIEAWDPSLLARVVDVASETIGRKFGTTDLDTAIQAHVVTVTR